MSESEQHVEVYAPYLEGLRWASVRLWYDEEQPTDLLLTPDNPAARWTDGTPGETYTYQVTFMDDTGQTIQAPPAEERTANLLILSPFVGTLSGRVWLSPWYEELGGRLLITIRYEDEENDFRRDHTLALKPGEMEEWRVPVINPDVTEYEYHATVLTETGPEPPEWKRTDDPTLLFHPKGQPFDVRIVPLISPVNLLVKISLEYEGKRGVQSQNLMSRQPFEDELHWRFLAESDSPSYRYQVTVFDENGVAHEQPEETSSDTVLIITGPQD